MAYYWQTAPHVRAYDRFTEPVHAWQQRRADAALARLKELKPGIATPTMHGGTKAYSVKLDNGFWRNSPEDLEASQAALDYLLWSGRAAKGQRGLERQAAAEANLGIEGPATKLQASTGAVREGESVRSIVPPAESRTAAALASVPHNDAAAKLAGVDLQRADGGAMVMVLLAGVVLVMLLVRP